MLQEYYNPNHDDQAQIVHADGSVAGYGVGDIPASPVSWGLSASWIQSNPQATGFWGLYLLKYYASPGTYPW
jgi:hypothetical protein